MKNVDKENGGSRMELNGKYGKSHIVILSCNYHCEDNAAVLTPKRMKMLIWFHERQVFTFVLSSSSVDSSSVRAYASNCVIVKRQQRILHATKKVSCSRSNRTIHLFVWMCKDIDQWLCSETAAQKSSIRH